MSLWRIGFFVWGSKAEVLVKRETEEEAKKDLENIYDEDDRLEITTIEQLDDKEGILMKVYFD